MATNPSQRHSKPSRSFHEVRENASELVDGLGSLLADAFHYLTLFAIGATVAWAAIAAFLGMLSKGHASIDDILLLFIYLELGGMVGIYFKTNLMPVRCLIYIAITALSRLLISDIQAHHQPDQGILLASGAILMLAVATLAIRKTPDAPSQQADKTTTVNPAKEE